MSAQSRALVSFSPTRTGDGVEVLHLGGGVWAAAFDPEWMSADVAVASVLEVFGDVEVAHLDEAEAFAWRGDAA